MPKKLKPLEPARFGLARFADLLPARDHIVGEDAGSFDGFREEMTRTLAPFTPYESVIAENLISIEWELIQHRRMRDTGLRSIIRDAILKAVVARERAAYDAEMEEEWDIHEAAGGTRWEWDPAPFHGSDAAEEVGRVLAAQAVSGDPAERTAANAEIEAMGLEVVELMGEAYRTSSAQVRHHENKSLELERRRREVKRDFDDLQKNRPVEAEVIEG